jgi:P-type Cu+ transporter
MAKNKIPCCHCGADCGSLPLTWNEKQFCCNGCQQVYQMLHELNMQTYYSFDQNPGIKVEELGHQSKFAFLDKSEIQQKMYEFHEGDIAKVTFYIPSIHCASCIWLLEHLTKLHLGIKYSWVQFVKKECTISFNTSEISLRQVVEILVSIHYIPDLSLQRFEKTDKPKKDKVLLYKIGVAGFVFGNVMLYSLPEYFNGQKIEGSLGTFLYYLCYVLTVPLVFYSGSDYIISAWKNIKKGILNLDFPIATGIITLFLVTSYQVITNTGPGYSDSLAGFLFFLLLSKWYQSKTYEALSFDRDYKSYFPVAVTRIFNEIEESVLLEDIVEGDVLLIRNKELIPADALLLDGSARIDYSFVTGESTPIRKEVGEPLYAGGIQSGGAITIRVQKAVTQSHLTQLWNQSQKRIAEKKSLRTIIDAIGLRFTLTIIIVAISSFCVWLYIGTFSQAILVLTSVLIVACPCALSLALPFTFGTSMRMLGHYGMYIKNIDVIEKLTKISAIVFDKTGTITQPNEHEIEFIGTDLSENQLKAIVSLAKQSTHPLSVALTKRFSDITTQTISDYTELSGKGLYGKIGDISIRLGSPKYVKNTQDDSKYLGSTIHISCNDEYLGYFAIHNKYRDGFRDVVSQLSNYSLYLSSGDTDAEKTYLEQYFKPNAMHFNQQPQDKMDFIAHLRAQGNHVMMTGDGLNDAGAFLQADVGISVADDIYHFSPAGDAIVQAKSFHKLGAFINYSNRSLRIVRICFTLSLCYNIVGLGIAVTGHMSPVVAAILMPISSVTVVAFATFATRISAKQMLS